MTTTEQQSQELKIKNHKEQLKFFSESVLKDIKQNLLKAEDTFNVFLIFFNNKEIENLHNSLFSYFHEQHNSLRTRRDSLLLALIIFIIGFLIFIIMEENQLSNFGIISIYVLFNVFCFLYVKKITKIPKSLIFFGILNSLNFHALNVATIIDLIFNEDKEINEKMKQLGLTSKDLDDFLIFSCVITCKKIICKDSFSNLFIVCLVGRYYGFCKKLVSFSNYYKNFETFYPLAYDSKIPDLKEAGQYIEKAKTFK